MNLENMKNKAETPIVPFDFKIYIKSKKGTQDMYKLINECKEFPSGRIAWDKRYTFNDVEWKHIFKERRQTLVHHRLIRPSEHSLPTEANHGLQATKKPQRPSCAG